MRRGFTLLEVLLVIGILTVIAAVVVPTYRNYQAHSDLETATDQITQALGRAKLLSESGKNGSMWGYSVTNNTLFKGSSYQSRDAVSDELYAIPPTIGVSGLPEVSFTKLTGMPTATGVIILTSLLGEQAEVDISIDQHGIVTNRSDKLTICHCISSPPRTMKIEDNAWPAHQRHGDYLGACKTPETHCEK
ncbi:MAG TPA: type II secretion system protein [Candidatus Peribacteraceae bacterium]|nr:type II secretion system protein [Candidatus Peribacteraceae bacterium]